MRNFNHIRGPGSEMDKALLQLLDEAAIRDVHARYCRGVDRLDWDLVRSCYHPDAVDDHGDYVGDVEGFIAYCKKGTALFESTNHFICNQLVRVSGDKASAEHYGLAYHRLLASANGPAKDIVANVRFIDQLERRNDAWRILKRVIVIDSERTLSSGESWINPVLRRAMRDKTDPSYAGLLA